MSDLETRSPNSPNLMLLSAESFPSKVTLVYMGEWRPISGKRKELLQAWQKMLKDSVPKNITEVFPTEMLFREGDSARWIVIQKPLVKPLPEEVKVGQSLAAYVVWMGATKADGAWEWLFAMNEFDAQPLP